MVDGIGEVLSLEAYSSLHIVGASALADVLLHIVAGIYLHARAVCPYLHGARAAREDCVLWRYRFGVRPQTYKEVRRRFFAPKPLKLF